MDHHRDSCSGGDRRYSGDAASDINGDGNRQPINECGVSNTDTELDKGTADKYVGAGHRSLHRGRETHHGAAGDPLHYGTLYCVHPVSVAQ